ncbi:MAG: FAD-dependent oxidoreductase [Proteobacteria bacterium]|nr:FAD-dependent oxidoreductase [Pseudomonadota bacterium]
MKVIIIGLNHAGCAAAKTLLNLGGVQLHIYDQMREISFLSCGMALWIGGQLASGEGLFYASPDDFSGHGTKVFIETRVDSIDFKSRKIFCTDKHGKQFVDTYDKLLLTTGSRPRRAGIPGIDLDNIFSVKTYRDGEATVRQLARPEVRRIGIVGAGYVGVEMAEACCRQGKEVYLFDTAPRILYTHTDRIFSELIAKRMTDRGIKIYTGTRVTGFDGTKSVNGIRTSRGRFGIDMALVNLGSEPCTELGRGVLNFGPGGTYRVDDYQQTNLPDVYAAGDCACVYNNATEEYEAVSLASNAIRTGIIAALNIAGFPSPHHGSQASSGLSIYDMKLLTTGISVRAAQNLGLDVKWVDVEDAEYLNASDGNKVKVTLRLVYMSSDRALVGAQIASLADLSGMIHALSLAVQNRMTIDALAWQDVFIMSEITGENLLRKAALQAG